MKTLYRGPLYRVIHSTEEEAECLADGWLPTPEDGKQYIVHTAIQAPTTHFAPSIEAEKREAPAAGFCPEPEQSSYVIPAELGAIRLVASAAEPLIALPKKKRPYPVKIAKPNDAEVKALAP